MAAVTLRTADGVELHADYAPATVAAHPPAATVPLHPHPLMGGDLHAAVPPALAAVELDAMAAATDRRPKVLLVAGADHFRAGRLGWLSERVQALLSS